MAELKKNQMANIVFPNVDGTDFATIESGITASDFESKMTKKFFGVTHGNSTAFTSGTISKAATLVRSGLMQQTLKAAETNYDYIIYSFAPANTSLAQQLLVFQTVTNDDVDIYDLISDVDSQVLLNASMISDVQSALDSQALLNLSSFSDVLSAAVQTNSRALVIQSLVSDVDSQVLLNASMISDVQSALDSHAVVVTSNFSDVMSNIDAVAATVTASDMSDIASRVWATAIGASAVSRILVIQSLVSDVDSQVLLNASMISDVQSALDSQALLNLSSFSDVLSAAVQTNSRALVIESMVSDVDSQLTENYSLLSDIDSQITLNTSTLSDVYSLVSDVDSQVLLNASMISDIDSQLLVTHSLLSDVESQIDAGVDVVSISTSTAAADNLEASAEVIITGAAETGTLSTTVMTTDLTEATDDHYIGRVIIWTSGVLLGQATDITDYAGSAGTLTYTAVTEAPSNGDTFLIL